MNPPSQITPARPLRGRAKVVVALLVLGILADVLAVVFDIGHLNVVNALAGGEDVSFERIDAADIRQGIGGVAQALAFLLTMVAFLVWFRRAYRNLPALGAQDLRYKRGWAVGAWFVPILAWFRPKKIANDIWRASDPELPAASGSRWRDGAVSPLLHWWWAALLISWWVGNASGRLFLSAETLSEQQLTDRMAIGADATSIVAGVLAILVVRAMTRRQQERTEKLEREPTVGSDISYDEIFSAPVAPAAELAPSA